MTGRVCIRGLALWVAAMGIATVCAGQSQTPQSSNGGMYPPGAAAMSNIPSTSPPTDKDLKHFRQRAYQRMRSDSKTIQELAADLNSQFNAQSAEPASKKSPHSGEMDAVKTAEKIEKLAAEIERLMRCD